ncbi:MAG TPA: hypothetical protein VM600_09345, partial [Actinomycetota bacterium]|nr:hypothetical protein [Actinomycetota bacterium]
VTKQVCNRAGQVDCNNDDYFHPAPRAGHYLRTHWNVGSPLNRFIEGCLSTGGEFKSGSLSLSYLVTTPVVHAIPPNCRGRLFAISDADASETSPLSGTLLACWRANGVVVGCGGLVLDEQGEVPLDADSVQLYGVGIRPIEYVFSIV